MAKNGHRATKLKKVFGRALAGPRTHPNDTDQGFKRTESPPSEPPYPDDGHTPHEPRTTTTMSAAAAAQPRPLQASGLQSMGGGVWMWGVKCMRRSALN